MTKRIFRSILAVSLAVLLASLVLIVGVLHGYFQDRVADELESLAEYIAHGVEETGADYLSEDLPNSYRVTWVDTDGTVLFDNQEDPARMENHGQREEIREGADMLGWTLEELMEKTILAMRSCEAQVNEEMKAYEQG